VTEPAVSAAGPLEPDEVRRRAAGGAAALGVRNIAVLAFGLIGNLVLARLLVPEDFGLVALGQTAIIIGRFVTESGIVASLVGRERAPDRGELAAVFGFQLALAAGVVAVVAAIAVPFGRDGFVALLMAASVPVTALRSTQVGLLERNLDFRLIATADAVEALVQYVWAIGLAAAGAGVWALASAAVARSAAGSALMLARGPIGLLRPRWRFAVVRPLLAFGLRLQAANAAGIVRDQGLTAGIAAVAGTATLGVWALAFRVMQAPMLLFGSLWRVSYPAMAQLRDGGRDARVVIERAIGVVGVASGAICVPIAASAPGLIEPVLGARWHEVPAVLGWSALAVGIASPIAGATIGYVMAAGDAKAVLRDGLLQAVVWLAVALPLLKPLGPQAAGLGWVAAAFVDVTVLGGAARRRSGARIVGPGLAVTLPAVAAGTAGWFLGSIGHPHIAVGLGAAAVAEIAFIGLVAAVAPVALRDALRLARQGVLELRPGAG